MKPQPIRAFLGRRSHSFKPWNCHSQKSITKRGKVLRFSVLKYHKSQSWNMRPLLVLVHFPISKLPQASFSRQVILSYANQFSSTRNVHQFPHESKLICIRSKARSIVTFYFPCSIFYLYAKVPVSFHATFLGNDRGGVFPPFLTLSFQLLSIYRGLESIFDVTSTRHHQHHDSQHYNCYGSKNFWMLRYPIQ